jgi:copper resistance protein B
MKNNVQTVVRAACLMVCAGVFAPASVQGGEMPAPVEDDVFFGLLLFDRLEYAFGEDEDALVWDVQGWYGGDYNRLWVETEGEDAVAGGEGGEAEAQVLYSRLIAPFWDLQAGLGYQRRYGPGPDHDRVFAVVGLEGLAPYWFEVNPELRISEDGDVSAHLEAEYELLLTQRLILQPRFETAIAAQEVEELGVGQGFNYVEAGLRLRYEIKRELAPYIGISWNRLLGETADLARDEGEDDDELSLVLGVRVWF